LNKTNKREHQKSKHPRLSRYFIPHPGICRISKYTRKSDITLPQMQAEASFFQCFIAETDAKEIIGFASYFFAYYSWSGKAVYLDDLYVTAPYRKQGVGKQLLGAVIQLAKDTDCKKVRWQVSKWNQNAIAFYTQMDAVVDDVEINCEVPIPTPHTH